MKYGIVAALIFAALMLAFDAVAADNEEPLAVASEERRAAGYELRAETTG